MTSRHTRTTAMTGLFLVGLALAGCTARPTTTSGGSSATTKSAAPTPAPDLSGSWKQTNSHSKDAYQAATVKGDAIELNWVTDGGDTRSLYWAGSYDPPTKAGDFTWKSINDTSKTSKAMLASPDKTKAFTYSNGAISYKVSLMGTTTTVRLAKQ